MPLLKRLNDSASLTDVLIQMEDFLDSMDIYVFKNWFDGVVVEGPIIKRYWVSMILEYDYENMPDPSGGLRLIKHGAKVIFRKADREEPVELESPDDYRAERRGKPKMTSRQVWHVEIIIPRKFIEELDDDDLELYDQDVDTESVSDARDEDIDAGDAIKQDDEGDSAEDDLGLEDEESEEEEAK